MNTTTPTTAISKESASNSTVHVRRSTLSLRLKPQVSHFSIQMLFRAIWLVAPRSHVCSLIAREYARSGSTVRTGHGTTDWFHIGKGVRQGCILSACLFNLYAEHIIRNAGSDEAQAGIKIAGRNTNNLRYADDTTLMEENEEELKSLLMKVKE